MTGTPPTAHKDVVVGSGVGTLDLPGQEQAPKAREKGYRSNP